MSNLNSISKKISELGEIKTNQRNHSYFRNDTKVIIDSVNKIHGIKH